MFYGREDVTFNNCKYNFFLQSLRKLSFFRVIFKDIYKIFDFFLGKCGRIVKFLTTKRPSSIFPRKPYLIRLTRFLVRLCLFKMTSRKLDTPTLVSKITSKSCLTNACQYGLWFYGRILGITLSINKLNMHFN